MFKLLRQTAIVETIRKALANGGKNTRFSSCNDGKPPSNAEPPSLCCPPNIEPPPCPPPPPPCGPPCPPPICTAIPDPNNPCNYCPPENQDPDEPDMTRVKRLQCLYQQDDGIPIHLKGGRYKAYLFHFMTIIGGLSFIQCLYTTCVMINK